MPLELRNTAIPRLDLKITPRMRLAFDILRMPRADLETLLDEQWLENPALERDGGESEGDPAETSDIAGHNGDPRDSAREHATTNEVTADRFATVDWNEYLGTYIDDSRRSLSEREARTAARDRWLQNLPAPSSSLIDHLLEQVRFSTAFAAREQRVAALLIEHIDEDGYLSLTLEDVAFECDVESDVVERVLRKIQDFDPPGIGARDLRECLLLQLRARGEADGLAAHIVRDHLALLASHSYAKLAQALTVPIEDVVAAAAHVSTLEPKPGRNFGALDTQYIVPDVFVDKVAGEWLITLNDAGLPRLRVCNGYRRMLAESGKREAKAYINERLNAAQWLIECLEQRNRTLTRVMRSILVFQRDFFEHGSITHLKPLVQRAVAADIEVHESTVSRATADKYVRTPHGTFPLKFFFPPGVAGANQDPVSSPRVRDRIRDLIGRESRCHPLTDGKIVALLEAEHINVKRRTIAKYRTMLGIPTAHERRREL